MSVQTSVDTDFAVAIAGLPRGIVGRTIDRIASTVIQSGTLVVQGASDGVCKRPASSGDVGKALGVAPARVTSDSRFPSTSTADSTYQVGDNVGAIAEGHVWVVVEEAVSAGAACYVRHTANGGNTLLGAFRSDADTANAALLSGARYLTSTTGSGLALVAINVP